MIFKTISLITVLFMGLQSGRTSTALAQTADRTGPVSSSHGSLPQFSFGFRSGMSLSQHAGIKERDSEYTVASHWQTGLTAGAFLFLPVTSRFGIQQEVLYVQKGSQQDISVDILDIPTVLNVTYDMDYVEIPVLMKLAWWQGTDASFYSLAGTALSLKVKDRYTLKGEIDDGDQVVPLRADSNMSEVDMFDYSFMYGVGFETTLWKRRILIEHRFSIGWNTLSMPTYTYVPVGDEQILIDNDPVPLKNQTHLITVGICF